MLAELDLVREANTLQRARANFAAEDDVVISKPYTDFSGSRVLTMSRLSGRPLVEGGMSIPGAVGTIASGAFALRLLRAARRSGGVG